MFDDPFLLHCSQTFPKPSTVKKGFDDPFLLHCSQTIALRTSAAFCLMILFFYTALKHYDPDGKWAASLMILFFYTALKPTRTNAVEWSCLMILFFYTALKPGSGDFRS